jgi:adenosylhomocysteine nucleosidase
LDDVRIGVVVGLLAEARIAQRLGWQIAVGRDAVAGLLDQGVEALVSFGLAGGLAPGLRPGALIVPSEVIVGRERFATDPALSQLLGGTTTHTLFGGDAVVATTADKQRLYQTTGAVAVDLETGIVARAAVGHGVPFAVLRAICDPAERALPPAALTALDARGVIGTWRVLASVAAHPGQLPALLALAADAAAARRSLVARVRQIALARA